MSDFEQLQSKINSGDLSQEVSSLKISIGSDLLDMVENDIDNDDGLFSIELFEKVNNSSCIDINLVEEYKYRLLSLGFDAYNKKSYELSGEIFRILSDSGNITGNNNYAYMIRRNEIKIDSSNKVLFLLKLLRSGVQAGDAHCIVNMALTLAMLVGDNNSWIIVAKLFGTLSEYGVYSVKKWWGTLAKEKELEGFFVIYMLKKYNNLNDDFLDSLTDIKKIIKTEINNIPDWILD